MPQTDFLPTKQSKLAQWARTFSQQISAEPSTFGVSPEDAALLATRVSAFRNALSLALRTETRTAVTVTEKNAALKRMRETVRAVGRTIRANPAVSGAMLVGLGMIGGVSRHPTHRLRKPQPMLHIKRFEPHTLVVRMQDALTPTRRAKPVHVAGAILLTHVSESADAPIPPIEQWRFCGLACRHEFRIHYGQADVGKRAQIRAAWFTRTGEIGIYSQSVSGTIAA